VTWLRFAVIKESPLKSKNIKHKNLNILHRSAGSLKTERFARDSKKYTESHIFVLFFARFESKTLQRFSFLGHYPQLE
jgi:hypothetical protein